MALFNVEISYMKFHSPGHDSNPNHSGEKHVLPTTPYAHRHHRWIKDVDTNNLDCGSDFGKFHHLANHLNDLKAEGYSFNYESISYSK